MTYKIGDRVRYTGGEPSYNEPRHVGKLGTVTGTTGSKMTSVSWDDYVDGVLFSSPSPGGVYNGNIALANSFEMTKDPHIGEQITRAEWGAKPPVHGKDETFVSNIPADDPRVRFVAEELKRQSDMNSLGLTFTQLAQIAITSLREYLVATAPPKPVEKEYRITLIATDPHRKIQAIKEVRNVTDLGLKEAKDFVEGRLPRLLTVTDSVMEANSISETFTYIGASVSITEV